MDVGLKEVPLSMGIELVRRRDEIICRVRGVESGSSKDNNTFEHTRAVFSQT